MGWKEFVSLHHKIERINRFTIRVNNIVYDTNNSYDDVITKISPYEFQVDTYYHDSNILADSHYESSIKNYIKY